jgi:hypothetical protein
MKKLILFAIGCFAIVISSCNQNSPGPAPATSSTPTPTPTTTATSSMTATEALLVGDWIWDKTENYSSGNLYVTTTPSTQQSGTNAATPYTFYAGSHMVLKSSLYNGTVNTNTLVPQISQYYNADYYSYISQSFMWYVDRPITGEKLIAHGLGETFSGSANIITLNSTSLICQEWLPGQIPNGKKIYYHK